MIIDNNICYKQFFYLKNWKLVSLKIEKDYITFEKVIQANLKNFYYIKLYIILETNFLIKNINVYHFSNLFINNNNYIYQFNYFWVLENLYLIIIRKIYNQIAINYLIYHIIVSFIIPNYYWLKLEKMIKYYIYNNSLCKYTKIPKN